MSARRKDTPPWWHDDPVPADEDCDEFEWADQAPNAEQILIASECFRMAPERGPASPKKGGR